MTTERSAAGSTTVGSSKESLEVSASGESGFVTIAVFVTPGTAAACTSTTSVMSGAEELVVTGSALVHGTSPLDSEQAQPLPVAEEYVTPAGSMSSTVMGDRKSVV